MATLPFTYLIGWSKHNLYYYGVKYAIGCHPKNLWTSYFTSSDYVKQKRIELGEPDIIQIRKTFSCKNKAVNWEYKVLKRMKIFENAKFLNKCVAGKWVMDEDTKLKISKSSRGKKKSKMSETQRKNISLGHLGITSSKETRKKLSKALMGNDNTKHYIRTDEYKNKLSVKTAEYWKKVREGIIIRKVKNDKRTKKILLNGVCYASIKEAKEKLKRGYKYIRKYGVMIDG